MPRTAPSSPLLRGLLAVLAAVTMAVVGGWLVSTGGQPASPPSPEGEAAVDTSPAPTDRSGSRAHLPPPWVLSRAATADRVTGQLLPQSEPVRVVVPRLGIRSDLLDLGLDPSGAMAVPAEPGRAGWYALGPTPGSLGPAVIAGHVTWDQRPAVFHRLADVRPGDTVRVLRQDGITATFRVTRVQQVAKDAFPTDTVFGPADHAALRLVTCGGAYDAEAARYRDNVVVFARLTRSSA